MARRSLRISAGRCLVDPLLSGKGTHRSRVDSSYDVSSSRQEFRHVGIAALDEVLARPANPSWRHPSHRVSAFSQMPRLSSLSTGFAREQQYPIRLARSFITFCVTLCLHLLENAIFMAGVVFDLNHFRSSACTDLISCSLRMYSKAYRAAPPKLSPQ